MFRSVSSKFYHKVVIEDLKRVNTRLMAIAPRTPKVGKPTLAESFRQIKPSGYVALTFPLVTFALGVWQIKRSIWKSKLIEELKSKTQGEPGTLPETLEEISTKEYCLVKIRGHFDHSREILMGPRTLLNSKRPASTLISNANAGFFVLTPFKPIDRDYYIWVNRGWIPTSQKDPKTRQGGQIEGEIEITGLIRLSEKRPQLVFHNDPNANFWLYRDLEQMSAATGKDVAPISIDATEDMTLHEGPIGGQTLIATQNTHYNYALTWLTLSLLTSILWWQNFVPMRLRKVR